MRIQHPRATDAYARDPPSSVAIRVGKTRYTTVNVDDEGYLSIKPSKADSVMDDLASSYSVEYDRETGEVIGADPAADPDEGGDEPPDSDADGDVEDEDGDDEIGDVEAWANWNEEDWLSMGYQQRESDVLEGLVDDHLEEINEIETSENVKDAVDERLNELEG